MSTERKWRVVGIGQEDDQYLSVSGVNHERKRMYHTASEEEAKQVMSASRFQSAEIVYCTSHKTFALPKLIYKDGDNL